MRERTNVQDDPGCQPNDGHSSSAATVAGVTLSSGWEPFIPRSHRRGMSLLGPLRAAVIGMVALVLAACGAPARPLRNAGVYVGSAMGNVVGSTRSCLRTVAGGRPGTLGHRMCLSRPLGAPGACVEVGFHTGLGGEVVRLGRTLWVPTVPKNAPGQCHP